MNIFIRAGEYKSIKAPLEWTSIPSFAALTGENGTGKTQFLECVHGTLNQPRQANPFAGLQIEITEPNVRSSDVVLFPNMSVRMRSSAYGLSEVSSRIRDIITRASKNEIRSPYETTVLTRLRQLGATAKRDPNELVDKFASEFFYSDPAMMHDSIGLHFVNYEIEYANCRKRGLSHENAVAKLGEAPWETINDLLEVSGFSYEITTPRDMDLRSSYSLRFRHRELDRIVGIEDLSSGESTLIRLYLWLYAADRRFTFPQLVLLDEPDSHLHPTLIKSFIGSLEKGLVESLGCTVVMTTHRAETIAFVPDESLFEMHAVEPRIGKSTGKHNTLFILTNNLVGLLTEERRPVFVEDEADVTFYSRTIEILEDGGQWPNPIKPEFIAASLGKGKMRVSGGKDAVRKRVRQLAEAGLGGIVRGIIDRDTGNVPSDGIMVLERYSFESYLVDPLVIYAAALDANLWLPVVLASPIHADKVYQLADRSEEQLQRVADAVLAEIRKGLQPDPDGEELHVESVQYVNGAKIAVPRWLLERRGYDLLHSVLGPWPRLNKEELLRAYNRLRLIPISLREVLERCVLPLG
jgi:ABC-type multidrug transport system ATPase subunit